MNIHKVFSLAIFVIAGPAYSQTSLPDEAAPIIEAPASVKVVQGRVEVFGRVRDRSRVVYVALDGEPLKLAAEGKFRIRRNVSRGTLALTIAAIDEWGNRATHRIDLTRAPDPIPFADVDFGRYHALVIGNNAYRHVRKLQTAVNDARAVAELLAKNYGFRTTLMLDATRADVIGALARYRAKLGVRDNLLVYYAGHGVFDAVTQLGYWLPVDAEKSIPTNSISVSHVSVMLKAIRAKHVLIVSDSCYSGTLVRATVAEIKTAAERVAWVKRMLGKRGRTALTSGGLEPVVDSDGGAHSVFARAFIDALRENTGVLEGERLFDAIKRPVVLNADQTPQYSDIRRAGHEGGDFIFVRKDTEAIGGRSDAIAAGDTAFAKYSAQRQNDPGRLQVPSTGQVNSFMGRPAQISNLPDRVPNEAELWISIKDSADLVRFQAFLERYPRGPYASAARRRIQELNTIAVAELERSGNLKAYLDRFPADANRDAAEREARAWLTVMNTQFHDDIEEFLREFPKGHFATRAEQLYDELEKEWQSRMR